MKKEKRHCEYGEDLDTGKECTKIAKYECIICGAGFCEKHKHDLCGDCPFCDPPFLIPIE